jgi:hypothetical protein
VTGDLLTGIGQARPLAYVAERNDLILCGSLCADNAEIVPLALDRKADALIWGGRWSLG